ncbi:MULTISPECIES: DUF6711 family protein [unclassified Granulicatella]|uniref:DUF6711 family protein n=1 Tax=unclassified Granulicatella TaxID=2630493 RepID=UPI001072FA29|nr:MULTISPECIES: DUF6711 family protein [unclassified Granulicatella]MBF0779799.1 hypothetical protein [Granulicatella sp. 19428wC4_WM01]TFU96201.1 hypothetical protein E4T68_01705 [Granulicatella sp. WM01]
MLKLIINGVTVVTPKTFQVSISDIDGESSRNARGQIIRDRVAIKRKIECEWGMLTQFEIQQILAAVINEFVTVQYPDPQLGMVTKTFYVEERSSPAYSWNNHLKPWSGLKMSLIER